MSIGSQLLLDESTFEGGVDLENQLHKDHKSNSFLVIPSNDHWKVHLSYFSIDDLNVSDLTNDKMFRTSWRKWVLPMFNP